MKHSVTTCHVVAAHREPILNAGIAEILRQCEGVKVNTAENLALCDKASLLVTDGQSALDADVAMPVLIVDAWPNERMLGSLFAAGIRNYVLQGASAAELHAAVGHLLAGGNYFSPALFPQVLQLHSVSRPTQREAEVLALLAKGYCNKRIARQLGIQYDTVKAHMKSLMGKLGAGSRTQALAIAVQRGLVEIEAE